MMAENLDGKKSMNPVIEESFSGDGSIVGSGFPPEEINLIIMEDSYSARNDEGIVGVFPAGEINPIADQDDSFSRDDGFVGISPAGKINPINVENSFSATDEAIVGNYPATGINPITVENSRDDGIVEIFPPGGIIIPINNNNNMENSSSSFSRDDGIIAIFPADGTEEANFVPDDCSAAENQTPIVIIPGGIGNHGEPEQSILNEHPSSEESSPAHDNIVTGSGIVPETRIEPKKRAISRGSPGGTH